jgi:hypothetical protein
MGKICSICQSTISEFDHIKTCEKCKNEYHIDCWNENEGCATYGCPNVSLMNSTTQSNNQKQLKKTCPACKEEINYEDDRCPYCKTILSSIRPFLSTKDNFSYKEYKPGIYILVFTVLVITAPFSLIFGSAWYFNNKENIKKCNPMVKYLTLGGLSLSALYTILLLLMITSK